MNIDYRALLVDAISGTSISYNTCEILVNRGLAKFSGDQWNESWSWCKSNLENLSIDQLEKLYVASKNNNITPSDLS